MATKTRRKGLPTLDEALAEGGGSKGLPSLDEALRETGGGKGLPTLAEALNAKPAKPAEEHHGGGFLSGVGHFFKQTGEDLYNAAIQSPAALEQVHEALAAADPSNLRHLGHSDTGPVKQLGKAYVRQVEQDLAHPLRHPGNTILDVLPAASAGVRAGLVAGTAARAARAGDLAGAAKALVRRPDLGPRELRSRGAVARGHYSRGSLAAVTQKAVDSALQNAAKRSGVAENALHRRMAKYNERTLRVEEAKARVPGTRLAAASKKLKPEELRALRLVAEEVPVGRRLGAQEMRKARAANPREAARHQERIDVTRKAQEFLDEDPQGRPVFKPGATKLRHVYKLLKAASTDREQMLKNLDLMDEERLQGAKTKVGRIAAGQPPHTPAENLRQRLAREPRKVAAEYIRRFGNEVNTDNARELSPEYAASRESRAALANHIHEPASAIARHVYKLLLKRPPRRDKTVLFTAGGTGAGKSSIFDEAAKARHDIVYDTNLDNFESATEKIDQALASGRNVHVAYVYREPVEAFVNGVIPRAHGHGRVVPLHIHIKTHVGARNTIPRLIEHYKGNDHVTFGFFDNSRGLGHHEEVDLRNLPEVHNEIGDAVQRAYEQERNAGRLEPFVQRAIDAAAQDARRGRGAEPGAVGVAAPERAAAHAHPVEPFEASPNAVHIGNPAERTRILGRPQVSSTGTFGHTIKPASLKAATGGTVEHATERGDVGNIVAERHAEAVRLSMLHRRVDLVKRAGSKEPRRKDDVWVWTNKTASNERIPPEVRRFLDDPDALRRLPEQEQQTVLDKVKSAVMERHDWQADPEARAEFEQLAKEGKGVFVPRRLLGNAAKRSYNVGVGGGAVHALDAINNAQKAALVYLKVNYPVIQGLSNAAMGIIQQGFAYPINLTKAARLSHSIGPELAAVVDDIMGEGAVMQAAFQGFAGPVTHVSRTIANKMSRGVDLPARRAAFLHEAAKAGYGTPEKLTQLLEDDAKLPDLAEVAQRAKEAIVDYSELSPFERNVVRRLVFVYPWQKGATKYAGHFFRDHPLQAAAVGALGQQGAQINQQTLGPVPSYLQGVFQVGGGLVNPNGLNFFQTPAQIGQAAAGYLTGNPAAPTGQDFLGPVPGLAVALATRRSDIGQPLTGNLANKLYQAFVRGTPGFEAAMSAAGHGHASKTFPNPNDALYRFFLGGLYPRRYNRGALNRNAALERSGR